MQRKCSLFTVLFHTSRFKLSRLRGNSLFRLQLQQNNVKYKSKIVALPHKRHLHWRACLSQHWCAWARVALFQRSLESRWLVWLRRLCCLSLRRRLSISSHPLVLAACMFHSSVDVKLLCNKKRVKKTCFLAGEKQRCANMRRGKFAKWHSGRLFEQSH